VERSSSSVLVVGHLRPSSWIESREVVGDSPTDLLGNAPGVVRNEGDEGFVEVLVVSGVNVTRIEGRGGGWARDDERWDGGGGLVRG